MGCWDDTPAVCIGQGSWGVRVLFSITRRDGLFRIRITPRSAASSRATHSRHQETKQTRFSKSQTKYQRLLDGEGPSKNYLAEKKPTFLCKKRCNVTSCGLTCTPSNP
ncbi:hypothetical protein I7I51_07424 [Histoplasma capsulatum]|uniref:Uncharacterized protein n=1 Tax=Ajellomyces capsulatus TaxID=5037 RepID=A0A8A1LXQ7_AJECA|nr:hypothetical protein I7I51_07424 [Histoplasma capsulatum]